MKISLTFIQMGPTPWGPALQKQARGPPSRGRAVRCVPDLRQCLKRKRFVSATKGWGFLAPDMEVFSFAGIFSSKIGDDWDDKSWSVKELLIPALPCMYIYILMILIIIQYILDHHDTWLIQYIYILNENKHHHYCYHDWTASKRVCSNKWRCQSNELGGWRTPKHIK